MPEKKGVPHCGEPIGKGGFILSAFCSLDPGKDRPGRSGSEW